MTASSETPMPRSLEERSATLCALQPVYSALVREFVIEVSTCPIDEDFVTSGETVKQAALWFEQVDAQIQVHQLRQFLQTTPLASEAVLCQLLSHHMQKGVKTASDRDKTDFLLVQYFSLCAPSGVEDADLDLDYVAQVLEPVLGPLKPKLPGWLSSLETILQSASGCRRLSELLHSGVLEQGRKLKTQSAARYFEPSAMVAFARFSFMIRRIFFRLMHDDLNAIQDGLRELDRGGVSTIDCRRAQFSAEEPIARLRMICQSWKVMFHAEYSSGQPLRMLVDLRAAVDDARENRGHRQTLVKGASAGETQE
ncbi:MAG: hypothetical protein ACLQFM_10335 [Terriglobales bacterium]|jgi:hypothetical protein